MERPEKRQRSVAAPAEEQHSQHSCWKDAVAYIQSNGGTVHPALIFSSDRSVQTQAQTKDGGRENSAIPAGTMLIRIPSSCLLTVDTVSSTPFGKKLVNKIQSISGALQNDKSDLILALYLAHISSAKDIRSDHAAYLATLPPPTSYNNIPRRWDDTQLESLLGGTSLLTHVRKEQLNLKSDYKSISSAWNEKDGKDESVAKLPSFEQFDDMFAAVSSRGFAGLGSDDGQSDAMVPLLDLLDHRRGTDAKKDVRYSRRCSAKEGSGAHTCIEVVADRDLPPGSILHDTYGAKGNAQLLNRYGFCIANNLEPDGSSNDVVEISLKEDQQSVGLRAGPKSYTYGKLVRMVEMFQDQDGGAEGANEQEGDSGEDDMEAFLNQCDEEQADDGDNDVDGFDMMMYGEDGGMNDGEEEGDQEDEEKMLESECKALQEVSSALGEARERYSLKDEKLQDALQKTDNSPEHFAAVLVQSERRTIQLYQLAADKIVCRLKSMMTGSPTVGACDKKGDSIDGILVKQIDELVSAYATIRHGGLI